MQTATSILQCSIRTSLTCITFTAPRSRFPMSLDIDVRGFALRIELRSLAVRALYVPQWVAIFLQVFMSASLRRRFEQGAHAKGKQKHLHDQDRDRGVESEALLLYVRQTYDKVCEMWEQTYCLLAQSLELDRGRVSSSDVSVAPPTRPGLERVGRRSTCVDGSREGYGDNGYDCA